MSNNPVCVSIDIGYGNVKFCEMRDGQLRSDHFPSLSKIKTHRSDKGAADLSLRDLVDVPVGNSTFVVGRDIRLTLSQRADHGSHLQDDYIGTQHHMALFKGALNYLDRGKIDLLVTGLPVNFLGNKEKMKNILIGEHRLQSKTITVKDVWILPQPVGGYVDFYINSPDRAQVGKGYSLIIDVGFYTLDWIVVSGMQMLDERSGSAPVGMSHILEKLAELISSDLNQDFRNMNMIEEGIKNDYKMRIMGKSYDFSHLTSQINDNLVRDASSIKKSVGTLNDIDRVIIVGGGANCYLPAIKKILKHPNITVSQNSLYSNVVGFLLAGQNRLEQSKKS